LDIAIERETAMSGEVGLSGEIRPVNRIEQRILEAEKLGFKKIIIPQNNLKGFDIKKLDIQIKAVRKVEEAFRELFG
jgi:DNA repair protein RadA/Sms